MIFNNLKSYQNYIFSMINQENKKGIGFILTSKTNDTNYFLNSLFELFQNKNTLLEYVNIEGVLRSNRVSSVILREKYRILKGDKVKNKILIIDNFDRELNFEKWIEYSKLIEKCHNQGIHTFVSTNCMIGALVGVSKYHIEFTKFDTTQAEMINLKNRKKIIKME